MKNKNNNFNTKLVTTLLLLFFMGMFLLARTFMGIYIFGFRVGEYTILISFLFLFFSLAQYKNESIKKYISVNAALLLAMLISSFVIFVIISNGNFLNVYIYKSSSYIWSFGFLFIGSTVGSFINFKKEIFYLFLLTLLYIYFFSIYGIPDSLQNQLLKITDKFEYHKGSDILIMFLSVFFIGNRQNYSKNFRLDIFLCFSALFGPLLVYKSRGAFIAFLGFLILEIIFLKSDFKRPLFKNVILLVLVLFFSLQSIFIVNKSGFLKLFEVEEKVEFLVKYREVPLEENNSVLYFYEGRLFSGDGNLNWRLQIWQDIFDDLLNEQKMLFGFGYNEKFSAMDDPFRSGNDGTNENVHNFLINILGRGGLIHLILFLSLYYLLLKKLISLNNIFILNYVIPIIFASFFDGSMENSHFPILFYFTLGLLFNSRNNDSNNKL